jgi:hypothetical protein
VGRALRIYHRFPVAHAPPPVFRTRMILQWSGSCAQLVGTRTSLPTPTTPSPGPQPQSRSCGNASGQRRPLAHCRVPLPLRIPLDGFLIVHSYLAGFPYSPVVPEPSPCFTILTPSSELYTVFDELNLFFCWCPSASEKNSRREITKKG